MPKYKVCFVRSLAYEVEMDSPLSADDLEMSDDWFEEMRLQNPRWESKCFVGEADRQIQTLERVEGRKPKK